MTKIFRVIFLFLNVTSIVTLLLIHFLFKENSFQGSVLFYAFPIPVIILIILVLSIFLHKKYRKINFSIATLLLMIWLGRSFKISFNDAITKTDLEIVFWNAAHKNSYSNAFKVNENSPDVLVLAEANTDKIKTFQLKHPEYYFYLSERDIAIFSKTPITNINENKLIFSTTVVYFKVRGINFYAVDVAGSIDVPRAWGLDFINNQIKNNQHTVILGDFNTPLESNYFNNIKSDFKHAFNEKGNGFRETWFWNIPLLSLDHIWVSKDLNIIKTQKISTFKSDHAMIKTWVRL